MNGQKPGFPTITTPSTKTRSQGMEASIPHPLAKLGEPILDQDEPAIAPRVTAESCEACHQELLVVRPDVGEVGTRGGE